MLYWLEVVHSAGMNPMHLTALRMARYDGLLHDVICA